MLEETREGQHTSAYVSIRQHTSAEETREGLCKLSLQSDVEADRGCRPASADRSASAERSSCSADERPCIREEPAEPVTDTTAHGRPDAEGKHVEGGGGVTLWGGGKRWEGVAEYGSGVTHGVIEEEDPYNGVLEFEGQNISIKGERLIPSCFTAASLLLYCCFTAAFTDGAAVLQKKKRQAADSQFFFQPFTSARQRVVHRHEDTYVVAC